MGSPDLKAIVEENLRHALENGYFEPGEQLHGASAEEIADDMLAYAADVVGEDREELIPMVQEWLKIHRPTS